MRRHKSALTLTQQTETRTAREMQKILVRLGLIDSTDKIRVLRLYPGNHQRSEGAWSWVAEVLEQREGGNYLREICGSQHPAGEILTAEKVTVFVDRWGGHSLYAGKEDDEEFVYSVHCRRDSLLDSRESRITKKEV